MMRPAPNLARLLALPLVAMAVWPVAAQDDLKPDSAYVKLLKKAPAERVGQIVEIIGKRGTADDLAYLFGRTVAEGFGPAETLKSLQVLADAASTRNLKPEGDLAGIARLIEPADGKPNLGPEVRRAAIRLAGAWKAVQAVATLARLAGAKDLDAPTRAAALDALAAIGGQPAREAIEGLASPDRSPEVRALAVASLARIDVDAAADRAAGVVADAVGGQDLSPLIAAFLDRQGGAEKLAAALGRRKPTADGAKLGLRAIYALGRADETLVAELSRAAGLDAETRPPTKAEVDALSAEVVAQGDSARGEVVFRRPEMNCMKCHALSGAAGGVGPELSALGLSSPVDYVINSILIPDQAIKEEYQTRIVLTDDGRVLQGIMVEEDDKRLVLKDATAELRVVPVSSIEETRKGGSLMPRGLANLLTRGEFLDLVRFLSELGKPGPYALKATPTFQRWRVLKAPVDDIVEVLGAPTDRWAPAYAMVAGKLPVADIAAAHPGPFAYIQGELAVSASGPIQFRINSARGLSLWLDDKPLQAGETTVVEVSEGSRKLTIRVDAQARGGEPIRVEVAKVEGSPAEFSVVGGR